MARKARYTMPQFEDQVRFNWGFHDGTACAERGGKPLCDLDTHFDQVYADGMRAGIAYYKAHGVRPESSEPAWIEYQQRKAA